MKFDRFIGTLEESNSQDMGNFIVVQNTSEISIVNHPYFIENLEEIIERKLLCVLEKTSATITNNNIPIVDWIKIANCYDIIIHANNR